MSVHDQRHKYHHLMTTLHLTLKMTTTLVVKTSVTNNSLSQDYSHPDDHTKHTVLVKCKLPPSRVQCIYLLLLFLFLFLQSTMTGAPCKQFTLICFSKQKKFKDVWPPTGLKVLLIHKSNRTLDSLGVYTAVWVCDCSGPIFLEPHSKKLWPMLVDCNKTKSTNQEYHQVFSLFYNKQQLRRSHAFTFQPLIMMSWGNMVEFPCHWVRTCKPLTDNSLLISNYTSWKERECSMMCKVWPLHIKF